MTGGILTRSGRVVSPEEGIPSLEDIGYALSSIQRFGGYTRRPWSVAHHSFVVAEIVAERWEDDATRPLAQLAGLMHDAAEALTGDIPTPFKTPDMRELQEVLDERIFSAYFPGGYGVYLGYADAVHEADRAALIAEAYVVGPRAIAKRADVVLHFGAMPEDDALAAVHLLKQAAGRLDVRWIQEVKKITRGLFLRML